MMIKSNTLTKYLECLLLGDRKACRKIVEETLQKGVPVNTVYLDMIWPIMNEIDHLSRYDRIKTTEEHMATRINRTIVDQLQNKLPKRPQRNKRAVICCSQDEIHELGAQMLTDLFESDGWEIRFLGGGLNNDDIYGYVNEYGPELLVIYGTCSKQAPQVRQLIDTIKSVNAWPNLRIMVSGGLFQRAEGLWEEIGADAFAANPAEALELSCKNDLPEVERTINRRKRRQEEVKTTPRKRSIGSKLTVTAN